MRWLLVDSIDSLVLGERVTGRRTFDPSEELFQDHFPGFAVVPGVLLVEAMAQLAGKLVGYTVRKQRGDWPFPILSMADRLKFRRFVRPGEEVEMTATLTALRDESASVDVFGAVAGKRVVQGELVFVFNAARLDDAADAARLERIESAELRRLWADCPEDDA